MIVGLLLGADLAARRAAESQLERRLRREASTTGRAAVDLDSWPFLARLAASGRVARVRASIDDVVVSRLRVARISVDLRNVNVDRQRLVAERQVDLQEIGAGTAVAEITQADLRQALNGVPVVLEAGRIGLSVGGVSATVRATVTDGVLRLSAGGISIPPITVPKLPLLPCLTDAEARLGVLRLSCRLDEVPDELLREVNRRVTG